MKASRIVVAGIAGVAAIGALLLSGSSPPPQTEAPEAAAAAPPVQVYKTTEVLVTVGDVPMGGIINEMDVKWALFPEEGISPQYIVKNDAPGAVKDIAGSIARHPFVAGEPLRREKLIRGNGSGFLSAILPSGKRAVAITTDGTGATSAGGFVLPNDFIDVVRVYRDEDASRARGVEVYKSEIVLQNVRVLAIGQNIQERGGERFITGQTATLELDPKQTELIILAQRVGTLSLALRSLQDANKPNEDFAVQAKGNALTVVRFGVAQESVAK